MNDRQRKVADHCDGIRTSKEIAAICGDTHKYVQEVMLKFDLPRRKRGSAFGPMNGAYKSGRRIDRDGYVLVSAAPEHPNARKRQDRHVGVIYEHRLVMEQKLGRYLRRRETVDHIDGLRLHNAPDNLRLFACNADHLKATIAGQIPIWSDQGRAKFDIPPALRGSLPPIDTYLSMKRSGDARLRQILLAALQLGIDSPFLLGSFHHLEKAGIVDFSRPSLERALDDLSRKYA